MSREQTAIKRILDNAIASGEMKETNTAQLTKVIVQAFQGVIYGDKVKYILTKKKRNIEDMSTEIISTIEYLLKDMIIDTGN